MCLILLAINPNARFRLVVAANRDEFYQRPSQAAHFWADQPDLLAGRDVEMGGTWLGLTAGGRFSAVTNFREAAPAGAPLTQTPPGRSRGELTCRYLTGDARPEAYLREVATQQAGYRGFNLLVADQDDCYYYSNRAGSGPDQPKRLNDGYYGLSNQHLDCDWPKVIKGRQGLAAALAENPENPDEALFALLSDRGDGTEGSNSFIATDDYGTRAQTVLLVTSSGQARFEERSFSRGGVPQSSHQFDLHCNPDSSECAQDPLPAVHLQSDS